MRDFRRVGRGDQGLDDHALDAGPRRVGRLLPYRPPGQRRRAVSRSPRLHPDAGSPVKTGRDACGRPVMTAPIERNSSMLSQTISSGPVTISFSTMLGGTPNARTIRAIETVAAAARGVMRPYLSEAPCTPIAAP